MSYVVEGDIDAAAWAKELCTLLDRIESVATEDDVLELCRGRFEIAGRHGLEVVIDGEGSCATH